MCPVCTASAPRQAARKPCAPFAPQPGPAGSPAGNLPPSHLNLPSHGDHKYVYDYRNRLIGVQEYQTDTWNDTAEYKYDAQNRRVLKVVTNKGDLNGTTRFIWGGSSDWQCLEERDASDDLVARYTYAPGYIDAVAVQERDLNADGDFLDDDEVVYYHSSTPFSIYALTDGDENVIERYRYDAYGAFTVLDADFSDDADNASDVDNSYTFTARRLNVETALMQYRHRYYAPSLGRFLERDPVGAANRSVYEFVMSLPVRFTDSLGLWLGAPWCEHECYPVGARRRCRAAIAWMPGSLTPSQHDDYRSGATAIVWIGQVQFMSPTIGVDIAMPYLDQQSLHRGSVTIWVLTRWDECRSHSCLCGLMTQNRWDGMYDEEQVFSKLPEVGNPAWFEEVFEITVRKAYYWLRDAVNACRNASK